jgi:pimeloyl-ACP methyl ester carboxylesterase
VLTSFGNGRLFGARFGAGAPKVLALHGWRKDHTDLTKVLDGFEAIALDLPGFGASPIPDDVWGAAAYASALGEVLSEFESPLVVFGHSFGGRVAVNFAALFPEHVRALVLTGVPLIRHAPTRKAPLAFRLAKLANRVHILSDERMEAERRRRGSADYRAATGVMRDIFVKVVNESYEKQLAVIEQPVEMVWGEHDSEAPLGQAREALEILKNGQLTVVPGGSHWLPQSDPALLRNAIERTLP